MWQSWRSEWGSVNWGNRDCFFFLLHSRGHPPIFLSLLTNTTTVVSTQLLSHVRVIKHDNDVSKHNHTSQVKGLRSRKISNHRLGALNVVLKWEGEEPSSFTKILVDQISWQYCSRCSSVWMDMTKEGRGKQSSLLGYPPNHRHDYLIKIWVCMCYTTIVREINLKHKVFAH